MNRVMSEEKAFYTRLKHNLKDELTALQVRYHTEVNPVNKTRIHHLSCRLEILILDVEEHLKPYWEV